MASPCSRAGFCPSQSRAGEREESYRYVSGGFFFLNAACVPTSGRIGLVASGCLNDSYLGAAAFFFAIVHSTSTSNEPVFLSELRESSPNEVRFILRRRSRDHFLFVLLLILVVPRVVGRGLCEVAGDRLAHRSLRPVEQGFFSSFEEGQEVIGTKRGRFDHVRLQD